MSAYSEISESVDVKQRNESKDLTDSIQNKITIINESIECIKDELYKIQLYGNLLENFASTYSNELSEEFKKIIKKIEQSISVINDKTYLLEINRLKKIIKSESGRIIELTTPPTPSESKIIFSPENFSSDDSENQSVEVIENISDLCFGGIKKIKSPSQIVLADDYLDKIDFNVNIFKNKKILCQVALDIFNKNFDLERIKINYYSLKEFIHQVSLYYHNNPYHNFKHAISVLQFVHLITNKIMAKKYLSGYELFGLFIAALVHDIDHPGHTNIFEINNRSHLALKYNDKSVLENHHCSLAFFLIHSKDIQLLKNLNHTDFSIVREMIVECILSTDMKHHVGMIKDLEVKYYNGWDWNLSADKIFLAKILIHIADLSNQVRPFDVSYEGSVALRREFAEQVSKEEELKLPTLNYMRLSDDKSFYSSEHFFSSNTVKPMLNIMVEIFPELMEYYTNLDFNITKWKELMNSV